MPYNQASYLLGKAMALIEDLYICYKDPLIKNDYSHKIMLLKQDIELFVYKDLTEDNNGK